MEFPVDITFRMLGWSAKIHVTDSTGRMIGYIPFEKRPEGERPIYRDEGMGAPIYTIRAEHGFTHRFEDAAGRPIGEWGITPAGGMAGGKFVIIGGEPRFHLASESEWLDFFDRLIPSLPIVNGLTGLLLRPCTLAVREQDGVAVLRIIKKRMPIDICYTVLALDGVSGPERECLLLTAIVWCLHNELFRPR